MNNSQAERAYYKYNDCICSIPSSNKNGDKCQVLLKIKTISDDYSIGEIKYKRLTPKECWRLMGFKDEEFERAENVGISNTQLYKQAGNSIVVDTLVNGVFKYMFTEGVLDDKN